MTKRIRTAEQLAVMRVQQQRRRLENPEKYRELGRLSEWKRRLRKYGISEDIYLELRDKQNNLCGICSLSLKPGRGTHIDHNHTTNQVRGLLCSHCNFLIGNARENQSILQNAILYLEKYS